jgi:hypothetical protein
MCNVSGAYADGTQDNIEIYPIVTGTSDKGFSTDVTGYFNFTIDLSPFTFAESMKCINNIVKLSQEVNEFPRFQRFVKSLGGIPRIIVVFCDFLLMWVTRKSMFHN